MRTIFYAVLNENTKTLNKCGINYDVAQKN